MIVVLQNYMSKGAKACCILDVLATEMCENEFTIFRENDCVSIPMRKKIMEELSFRSEGDDFQPLYGVVFQSNMKAKDINQALLLTDKNGFYDVRCL